MAITTKEYLEPGKQYPGDKYGYYQIGQIKTYSFYEMMDLHQKYPSPWKWNYNDSFFKMYDWTQEPKKNIDELYYDRAKKLREEYDYLILYFSSGHDSGQMLHAFLDNNIYPDEICVWHSSRDYVSDMNEEFHFFTMEKLEKISIQYPKIKIRILDYANYYAHWDGRMRKLGFQKRMIDAFGKMMTVNRFITDCAHDTVEEWRSILEQGNKLAWICGSDKPRIRFYKNQWIFNFQDGILDHSITPYRKYIDNGNIGNYEFFFWSPTNESAQIVIKQCHLIKNKYDKQARENFDVIPGAFNFQEGFGHRIDVMNEEYMKTIYPRNYQENEKFFTKKSKGPIWGQRDQWWFNSQLPGSQRHWAIYLSHFLKENEHWQKWYNDGESIESGLKNCLSVDYIIG